MRYTYSSSELRAANVSCPPHPRSDINLHACTPHSIRVSGFGIHVSCSSHLSLLAWHGAHASGSKFRFRATCFENRDSGFGIRDSGFRFRVWVQDLDLDGREMQRGGGE